MTHTSVYNQALVSHLELMLHSLVRMSRGHLDEFSYVYLTTVEMSHLALLPLPHDRYYHNQEFHIL